MFVSCILVCLQDPDAHEKVTTTSHKTASPKTPKAPVTPKSEAGDSSVSTWVMDSSGFLSPSAAPTLKEVMELMDGVSSALKTTAAVCNYHQICYTLYIL